MLSRSIESIVSSFLLFVSNGCSASVFRRDRPRWNALLTPFTPLDWLSDVVLQSYCAAKILFITAASVVFPRGWSDVRSFYFLVRLQQYFSTRCLVCAGP